MAKKQEKIKLKQFASGAGKGKKQIATLKGLGLNKVNKVVELEDTEAVRGMFNKVKHLVEII
jgi:large subunit ribosomal protein L30